MTLLRRRIAVLAMALLLPALGGCGVGGFAGSDYQTDAVYQAGVGINDRSGTVDILGAVVVSGTPGSGTFVASLVNKDPDEPANLTGITGPEGVQVQLVKPVSVGPDDLVNLAEMGAVSVSGDTIEAGGFVRLTLTFDTGQKTSLNVTIVDRNGEFSQISPALPSAPPTR